MRETNLCVIGITQRQCSVLAQSLSPHCKPPGNRVQQQGNAAALPQGSADQRAEQPAGEEARTEIDYLEVSLKKLHYSLWLENLVCGS